MPLVLKRVWQCWVKKKYIFINYWLLFTGFARSLELSGIFKCHFQTSDNVGNLDKVVEMSWNVWNLDTMTKKKIVHSKKKQQEKTKKNTHTHTKQQIKISEWSLSLDENNPSWQIFRKSISLPHFRIAHAQEPDRWLEDRKFQWRNKCMITRFSLMKPLHLIFHLLGWETRLCL
jgi:hypothetical protein